MDPLSITASIIAVLQATSSVINICYDYRAALTDSTWGLSEILVEVRDLRDVLERLKKLAIKAENADPRAESHLPALKSLCEAKDGPLERCQEELQHLEVVLAPPGWTEKTGPRRRALIQSLRWPFKKADTEDILTKIRRLTATLSQALTIDHT